MKRNHLQGPQLEKKKKEKKKERGSPWGVVGREEDGMRKEEDCAERERLLDEGESKRLRKTV